jgi:predicted dehydrogenase
VVGLLVPHGYQLTALAYDASQEEEEKRAETLKQEWPGLQIVPDAAGLVAAGVQAALVAPQAHLRLAAAQPLIEAKIPVCVDKQLAPDYARAKQILDLVVQHDAPLMAGSGLLWSLCFRDIFTTVREGKIGTPLFAECFMPHGTRAGYWQDLKSASGGLVVNFGIHAVDPLLAVLGHEVKSVHAFAAKQALPDLDSEDTVVITVQTAAGGIGVGKVSAGYHWGAGKPVPTVPNLVVHGTDGALETFIDESDVKIYRGGNFGVTASYLENDGMVLYAAAFAEMVKTGKRPISVEHMDATMKVLDAARQSLDTGQPVGV